MGLSGADIGEDRHKETFARQRPLAGIRQGSPEALALILTAAVAENGLHFNVFFNVGHGAGFS
ncbi:hypothetical protein SDC9_74829 [bioreactor metagenome]|uniref:Uncharacterized protein n=1 Tax=bioreactor metagenome TaxID=1076179 RepID=A0A644YJX5_9ZZZZ